MPFALDFVKSSSGQTHCSVGILIKLFLPRSDENSMPELLPSACQNLIGLIGATLFECE
ncbi:hypothetical protein PGTUg99_016839 [Puccinia graminis f. sp. tritici]|uniref:Uncharacterized protein n=1 Tax=Puccinia graminis f. sp. tritici TaxID=56615 RepID=A0A5B0LW63_PUCGR|nr:hypothetical protein PGTUg99_016839 [Puccinia graminis f. sp. tritici]